MKWTNDKLDQHISTKIAQRNTQPNMGTMGQPNTLRQAVQNFAARNNGNGLKNLQLRDRRRNAI